MQIIINLCENALLLPKYHLGAIQPLLKVEGTVCWHELNREGENQSTCSEESFRICQSDSQE